MTVNTHIFFFIMRVIRFFRMLKNFLDVHIYELSRRTCHNMGLPKILIEEVEFHDINILDFLIHCIRMHFTLPMKGQDL